MKKSINAVFISDLHIPYEHPDALDFCLALADRISADTIYQVGDFVDWHTISRHPKVPELYSPGDEGTVSGEKLRFWQSHFPVMKISVGNHDTRPYKLASDVGIPGNWLKTVNEYYDLADTWKWDYKWIDGDIIIYHGDAPSYRNPLQFAQKESMSVVCGHWHGLLGVNWVQQWSGKAIWGMNTGCLVDQKGLAMAYGKAHKTPPIVGCGVLWQGHPYAVRMPLNHHGRWTGQVPF